jgi:rRNA maturation protein Nop10
MERPTEGRTCEECGVYTYNGPDHICVRYDGPPCAVGGACRAPTVVATIGAPGYGTVRVCENGHREELTPCGIYTLEQLR